MKKLLLLLLAPLLFVGCYEPEPNEWERLVIEEGSHRARPYRLTWDQTSKLAYLWQTNDTWAYNLGNRNQCDWNKLGGFSFHKFTNHKDAFMVAWRYDLAGHLWLAPYYHENGNTWWARADCTTEINAAAVDPDLPTLRVNIGDEFETHLTINRDQRYTAISVINKTTGEGIFWERTWDRDLGRVREIYPWFGGDEEALHDIILLRRLLGRE